MRLRQATGGRVGLDSWAFQVPAAGLWAAEAWAEAASGAGEWATDRKEAREGERVPAIARMPSTCVTMPGTCGQHLMRSLPTRTLRLGSHCEADSREATQCSLVSLWLFPRAGIGWTASLRPGPKSRPVTIPEEKSDEPQQLKEARLHVGRVPEEWRIPAEGGAGVSLEGGDALSPGNQAGTV